ncbi:MAG TPA: LysR family transcriptional regulator [Sphingobium sp.]
MPLASGCSCGYAPALTPVAGKRIGNDVDLNKLDRVVAIYEAGSFRKAAKLLGLTQPALTWSIQNLEDSLNARLFDRGPRGIRPTALCESLVKRARLILREQARMMDDVQRSARNETISVGVHSILMTPEFARCIAEFSERWPSATLRVREGYSSDLLERLQKGELDFACCAVPDDTDYGASLKAEPLTVLNYSVVADAGHPVFGDLAEGRPIAEYRWVEFDTAVMGNFPGKNDIVAVLSEAGHEVARECVRTASMTLIKLLVLEGDFIGLIADELVAQELESGQLRRIPGTGITASQFGFVSVKDSFATSAANALQEILARSAFEPLRRAEALAMEGAKEKGRHEGRPD